VYERIERINVNWIQCDAEYFMPARLERVVAATVNTLKLEFVRLEEFSEFIVTINENI